MLANDPRLISKSKEYESNLMESVAVIKIAVCVKRKDMVSLHRDQDKPFRLLATRVRSKKHVILQKFVSVNVERKLL